MTNFDEGEDKKFFWIVVLALSVVFLMFVAWMVFVEYLKSKN